MLANTSTRRPLQHDRLGRACQRAGAPRGGRSRRRSSNAGDVGGLDLDHAGLGIDGERRALRDREQRRAEADDVRDPERARDDRGVVERAAARGRDAPGDLRIEVRDGARRELVGDHDAGLGRRAGRRRAGERRQHAVRHVADVDGAGPEIVVVDALERRGRGLARVLERDSPPARRPRSRRAPDRRCPRRRAAAPARRRSRPRRAAGRARRLRRAARARRRAPRRAGRPPPRACPPRARRGRAPPASTTGPARSRARAPR